MSAFAKNTVLGRENTLAFYDMLGSRPTLHPIYDSATHGATAADFRQHCDNKGSTVSVAVMADGTVCGGYRKKPWIHGADSWKNEPEVFLFRLRLKAKLSPLKTTGITNAANTVLDYSSYGPYFGAHQDLNLLDGVHSPGTFTYTESNFPLTGGFQQLAQPGPFSIQVFSIDETTNVSSFVMETPWASEPAFTVAHLEELRKTLCETASLGNSPPNLLLFGPVGAGKSSLARSLLSALAGRMVGGITVGTGECTVTKRLKKHPLLVDGKQLAWLWDTAGIEGNLYQGGEFGYLLQGNLSHGTELAQGGTTSDRTAGFNPTPRESERVDCVIMCLAAADVSDVDTTKRLQLFNSASRQREVASMLVVTKVSASRAHM